VGGCPLLRQPADLLAALRVRGRPLDDFLKLAEATGADLARVQATGTRARG
jgi:hypothetical protein